MLAPYRGALLLAVALLLCESLVMLTMPWFAGRVAQALLGGVVPGALLLAWLGVLTVQAGLSFGNGVVLGSTSSRVVADLGSRVYDHLQSLPLSWHQQRKRGEILAMLVNDVWRINSFLTGVLTPLLPLLVTCVGALILLLRIDLRVGFAVAVAMNKKNPGEPKNVALAAEIADGSDDARIGEHAVEATELGDGTLATAAAPAGGTPWLRRSSGRPALAR